MRDERQDGDRLLRTQTEKTSSWCTKWIPNLPKQCCTQASKLCLEAPGPSCLCWASQSLMDGHPTAWLTFPLVSCLLLGFLGVWKIHVSTDLPLLSSLLLSPLFGVCAAFTSMEALLSNYTFSQIVQEMNYITGLFFCQTWSKMAWEFRAYRGWGWPTGRQTHKQQVHVCFLQTGNDSCWDQNCSLFLATPWTLLSHPVKMAFVLKSLKPSLMYCSVPQPFL